MFSIHGIPFDGELGIQGEHMFAEVPKNMFTGLTRYMSDSLTFYRGIGVKQLYYWEILSEVINFICPMTIGILSYLKSCTQKEHKMIIFTHFWLFSHGTQWARPDYDKNFLKKYGISIFDWFYDENYFGCD